MWVAVKVEGRIPVEVKCHRRYELAGKQERTWRDDMNI